MKLNNDMEKIRLGAVVSNLHMEARQRGLNDSELYFLSRDVKEAINVSMEDFNLSHEEVDCVMDRKRKELSKYMSKVF